MQKQLTINITPLNKLQTGRARLHYSFQILIYNQINVTQVIHHVVHELLFKTIVNHIVKHCISKWSLEENKNINVFQTQCSTQN